MRCTENMVILEILRLREEMSYSLREIERTSICSKTTAGKILNRCKELNLDYGVAVTLPYDELKAAVFGYPLGRPTKKIPDFNLVHEKLQSTNQNLQYQWESLLESGCTDLSYSRFCHQYREWKLRQGFGVYTPLDRKPGEKMFVDWAGKSLKCVLNEGTGELSKAYFFITAPMPIAKRFPPWGNYLGTTHMLMPSNGTEHCHRLWCPTTPKQQLSGRRCGIQN